MEMQINGEKKTGRKPQSRNLIWGVYSDLQSPKRKEHGRKCEPDVET